MNRTKEAGLNQLFTELKSTLKASLPEQQFEVESQVINRADRKSQVRQCLRFFTADFLILLAYGSKWFNHDE